MNEGADPPPSSETSQIIKISSKSALVKPKHPIPWTCKEKSENIKNALLKAILEGEYYLFPDRKAKQWDDLVAMLFEPQFGPFQEYDPVQSGAIINHFQKYTLLLKLFYYYL